MNGGSERDAHRKEQSLRVLEIQKGRERVRETKAERNRRRKWERYTQKGIVIQIAEEVEVREREKKQRLRVTEGKYIHKERDKIENAKGVEEIEKERKTEAERNRGWKWDRCIQKGIAIEIVKEVEKRAREKEKQNIRATERKTDTQRKGQSLRMWKV